MRLVALSFMGTVLAGLLSSVSLMANEKIDPIKIRTPHLKVPSEHTQERAGHSDTVCHRAVYSRNAHYQIATSGGGKLFRGDGPVGPMDGHFGWDYVFFKKHPNLIFLGFHHDRAIQPNYGKYETVGPRSGDIFTIRPVRRKYIELGEEEEHAEGGEHGGGHSNGGHSNGGHTGGHGGGFFSKLKGKDR